MNCPLISQESSIHIGGYTKVSPAEIVYCQGDRNYTRVHFARRAILTLSITMRVLHERLGEANFLRVNRSTLVNRRSIADYKEGEVILGNGLAIPVSRRRREYVKKSMSTSIYITGFVAWLQPQALKLEKHW